MVSGHSNVERSNIIFYYYPLCPISNKLLIVFKMINISKFLNIEEVKIVSRQSIQKLPNIYFQYLPILSIPDRDIHLRDSISILNFLSSVINHDILKNWKDDREIQFFEQFFDQYMFFDIYKYAIFEKTQKLILYNNYFPNNENVKIGVNNIKYYLDFFEERFKFKDWVQGKFSISDISCFSFMAVLDYCFFLSWYKYPNIKNWYRRMKSNIEMNFILQHRIPNFLPPSHYEIIDF